MAGTPERGGGGASVAVCLVARNEVENVANLASRVAGLRDAGRVDAAYVVDGESTDRTPEVAAEAGAIVIPAGEVLAEFGPLLGKGDSMWRAGSVITEDVVVFLDADIDGDIEEGVLNLARPIVEGRCDFSKGFFRRTDVPVARWPQLEELPTTTGRLTEWVARPSLEILAPDLARYREPLSGQVAIRRALFSRLPIVTRYGVETGMLFDVHRVAGADRVAEVDLGVLYHQSRADEALESAALEVLTTIVQRVRGRMQVTLDAALEDHLAALALVERPPLDSLGGRPGR